jgi:hypothetical protein
MRRKFVKVDPMDGKAKKLEGSDIRCVGNVKNERQEERNKISGKIQLHA